MRKPEGRFPRIAPGEASLLLTPTSHGRDNRASPGHAPGSPVRQPSFPRIADAMSATTDPGRAQSALPDALGRFGAFGGRFVPETLMDALNRLCEAYEEAKRDPQ